jgi:amino acid permease
LGTPYISVLLLTLLAAAQFVYHVTHPGMTEMEIFLKFWWEIPLLLAIFVAELAIRNWVNRRRSGASRRGRRRK